MAVGPCSSNTLSSGVNFSASLNQLCISDVGATIKAGLSCKYPACFSMSKWAKVCAVLPKPISSARIPPCWVSLKTVTSLGPAAGMDVIPLKTLWCRQLLLIALFEFLRKLLQAITDLPHHPQMML